MQQQKSYQIPGLLKIGMIIEWKLPNLYINIESNLKHERSLSQDELIFINNQCLQFIYMGYLQLTNSKIRNQRSKINAEFILQRNIPLQQFQRIEKLIIVSDAIQQQQAIDAIPSAWSKILTNKIHLVLKLNELMIHKIELTQNQIDFLSRINNTYQEEIPFYGRDISEYPISQTGVPEFLDAILQYYERHDDYLRKQGVFRISGSIQQEQSLVQQFQIRNYSVIDEYDPDVVSTVFKNVLCQLKKPIFPFEMYDILKETEINISKEKLLEMFQVFFAYMPEVNRKTTKRIAELLFHVADYESENLMGLHNLSIVFAPCFLRSEQADLSDFQGAKIVVHHFNLLVQNVEYFLQEIKPNRNSISQKLSL